jgi:hypothetical protein
MSAELLGNRRDKRALDRSFSKRKLKPNDENKKLMAKYPTNIVEGADLAENLHPHIQSFVIHSG